MVLLQKGAAESRVDPEPQGAAESRVEPDLSGQGTAESRTDVEPAPVPTDEFNGDPVEVSAESRSEPGTMTNSSDCEPVLVDEPFVHEQSSCRLVSIFQLSVSTLRFRISKLHCLSRSCSNSFF